MLPDDLKPAPTPRTDAAQNEADSHYRDGEWRQFSPTESKGWALARQLERELAAQRASIIEECALACEREWKFAPNDKISGYRQNTISHGCIASAKAIRALLRELGEDA